jgi:hypothetical protein
LKRAKEARKENTLAVKDHTTLVAEIYSKEFNESVRDAFHDFLVSSNFKNLLKDANGKLARHMKTCKADNLDAVLKKESPRVVVAGFAHEVRCLELLHKFQKFCDLAPSNALHSLMQAVKKLLNDAMAIKFWIEGPTRASTLWKEVEPYAERPSDGTIVSLQGHSI